MAAKRQILHLNLKLSHLEEQTTQLHSAINVRVNKVLQLGKWWVNGKKEDDEGNPLIYSEISNLIENTDILLAAQYEQLAGDDEDFPLSQTSTTETTTSSSHVTGAANQTSANTETLKSAMARIQIMEKAFSSLSDTVDKQQVDFDTLKDHTEGEMTQKLEDVAEKMVKQEKSATRINKLEQRLGALEERETRNVEKLETIEKKLAHEKIKRENLEAVQNQREQKLEAVERKLDQMETSNISLSSKVEDQESSIQELTKTVETHSTSLENQTSSIQELTTTVEKHSTSLENQTSSIQEVTTTVEKHSTSLENQTSSIQELTTTAKRHSTSLENQTSSIQELTTTAKRHSTSLENQTSSIQELTTTAKRHSTSLENQTSSIQELTTTVERHSTSLENQTSSIQELTTTVERHSTSLENQTSSTQELTTTVERHSTSLENQTSSIQELTTTVERHSTSLENQTSSIQELTTTVERHSTSLENQTSSIQELTTTVERHSTSLEDITSNRETEATKLTRVHNKVRVLKREKNMALKNVGKQLEEVTLNYQMVCKIVADRLVPLERLRGILNEKVTNSDDNVDKLYTVIQDVADLVPKVSHLENQIQQTITPTLAVRAGVYFITPVVGNIIDKWTCLAGNTGGNFDVNTGIFTSPVAGTYAVALSIYQIHEGKIVLHIKKTPSGSNPSVDNDKSWAGAITDRHESTNCNFSVVDMSVGDKFYVCVRQVNKSPTLRLCRFSIFLVK